jgi:hypothetical protein
MCGLQGINWVPLAKNRNTWKHFVDKEAQGEFLKRWYEREDLRREQRGNYESNREERERRRALEVNDETEDGLEEGGGVSREGTGMESEDLSEEESDGEDITGNSQWGRTVEVVQIGMNEVVVEMEEDPVALTNKANQEASEAFMAAFNYDDGGDQSVYSTSINEIGSEETSNSLSRGNKDEGSTNRQIQRRERKRKFRKQKFGEYKRHED